VTALPAVPPPLPSPPSTPQVRLVVGVGCSLGCPPGELIALIRGALARVHGTAIAVATVDRRAEEPCVRAAAEDLAVELRLHPADVLAGIPVPTPSAVVLRHVGTPSVAEAAALCSAGAGAELLVPKSRSAHATCAIAIARERP
jgi:cobalamin biosynthesis protein CbiG